MVILRDVDMNNFRQVISLELSYEDKQMVAPNMYSLAEAFADKVSIPKAIYQDAQLVGFIMYNYKKTDNKAIVKRLMIATEFQGNGYGKEALQIVLKELRMLEGINQVQLSYHPDNEKGRRVYKKLGFVETTKFVDGEVVALLDFT